MFIKNIEELPYILIRYRLMERRWSNRSATDED
jgi:hypothetical protein